MYFNTVLFALLVAFFIACGSLGTTDLEGTACNNTNGTMVVCENGSPILECNGSTYEQEDFSASVPPLGCTFECSNTNGEGTFDTICE